MKKKTKQADFSQLAGLERLVKNAEDEEALQESSDMRERRGPGPWGIGADSVQVSLKGQCMAARAR